MWSVLLKDTTSCPSQDLNSGRPTQFPEHWSLDYSRLTISRPYPVLLSFLSPFFYMHCSYRNPGLIVALEKNYLPSYLNSIIYCWKMSHSTRCHGHTQEHVTARGRNEPSRLIYNRSSNVVHLDNWSLLCDWQRLCAFWAWQSKQGETRIALHLHSEVWCDSRNNYKFNFWMKKR